LLLAIAPAVIGPWLFGGVRLWSVAALSISSLLSALLVALRPFFYPVKGHPIFPAPLAAFSVFVLYAAIRIPTAAVPCEAVLDVLRLAALLGSAWTIVELSGGQHGRWRWIAGLFLLSVSIMCLYALVQEQRGSRFVLHLLRPDVYGDRASGAFICPNHFASLLGIALALALALVTTRDAGALRVFAGYSLLVIPPALYLTQSRSGWIGALAGLVVTWILLAARRNRRIFWLSLFLAPLAAIGVACGVWAASPMVRARVEDAMRGNARLQLWQDTRTMIGEAPLFGHGPGSFRWVYPRYWHHLREFIDPEHPHNEPLELVAEHGIAGGALALAGLGLTAWLLLRRLRAVSRDKDAVLIAGSCGAGAAALVHSLFDFNLHVFGVAAALLLVPGLALAGLHSAGATQRSKSLTDRSRRLCAAVAGLLAVLALVLTIRALTADLVFRAAERALLANRDDDAERLYVRAVAIDSCSWKALEGWGYVLRTKAYGSRDPAYRKAMGEQAEKRYREALRINPCHVESEVSLAMLYGELGDRDRAIKMMEDLVARMPHHSRNLFELGSMLRSAGRPADALKAFRKAREIEGNEAVNANIRALEQELGAGAR
jgi:O-antigen ligase/Flp pilus assembly protein TadD